MKKPINIVIWVTALVVVLVAAYVVYSKNTANAGNALRNTNQSSQSTTQAQAGEGDSQAQQSTAQTQAGESSSQTQDGSTKSDKVMVPDFTLNDLDGNPVKISDYKGKVVILNFWAVWCKYCKQEMPDLNELNKELEKDGEAVILAVDVQESKDTVNEYLKSKNINLKVLMDQDGSVSQGIFGVSGFPTTFVINKDGSLYTYIPGLTDKATLLNYLDKIKKGEPAN